MNSHVAVSIGHSACPHDCPSTCALDVEVIDGKRIGRLHGAKANTYTAGVICAKVARYAERIHHPERLLKPLVRGGAKGEGTWKEASWEAALDLAAEKFIRAEERYGSETVWPNCYAGTMGLVQRDGINRLRHAKKYSNLFDSFCTNAAWTGFVMGTGRLAGPDPREMAKSDCVVIWGTNAVVTQVNVMTHATRARKGSKRTCGRARRNGRAPSPACPWSRSRPSRGLSARRRKPSSGSATAFRGSATAP